MHETGTAAMVRAFHVMPGLPPPEGLRHAHDYRIEVVVSRDQLDGRGMVVDLDVLDSALQRTVALIDGVNLDEVDGLAELGRQGVTVEVLACWLHGEIAHALGPMPAAAMTVRAWESPTAFGGYRQSLADA